VNAEHHPPFGISATVCGALAKDKARHSALLSPSDMPPIRPTTYYFSIVLTGKPGVTRPPEQFEHSILGRHEVRLGDDHQPYSLQIEDTSVGTRLGCSEHGGYKLKTRYGAVFVRPLLVQLIKTNLRILDSNPDDYEADVFLQKQLTA